MRCWRFPLVLSSLLLLAALWGPACEQDAQTSRLKAVVDGPWITTCLPGTQGFSSYKIRLNLAAAHQLERLEQYFTDSACLELASEMRFQGEYELEVTAEEYIYRINLIYQQLTATALNAKGQAQLEADSSCGIEHWEIGKAEDISLRSSSNCRSFGILPIRNWNLVRVQRGKQLTFAVDLAADNERPEQVGGDDPALSFTLVKIQLFKLSHWQNY